MIPILNIVAITLVSLFGIASVEASVLDHTPDAVGHKASGWITGITGSPLIGTGDGMKQGVSLEHRVAVGEELRTGQDDLLEILWARRAMILIRPQSTVVIHESNPGQTVVSLGGGSVRVALAYHGASTDMVTVQTPSSRIYTHGGILEVDVFPPAPSLFSRVASAFAKTDVPIGSARVETVRVLEGEVGIESVTAVPGQSHMLSVGMQARIAAGIVEHTSALPQTSSKGVGLTDTDRRQGTPGELTRRLTKVHVTHALEVERQMNTSSPAIDRSGVSMDVKGTIISTSLGFPNAPLGQPGTTRGPAPPPPSSSVTSPLPPIQIPPIVSTARGHHLLDLFKDVFDDDKVGKQKHKGNDRGQDMSVSVIPPLPTLPAVADHSQAGGNNSQKLFQDFFEGGGKHHRGTSPLPTLPDSQMPTITAADDGPAGGVRSHNLFQD